MLIRIVLITHFISSLYVLDAVAFMVGKRILVGAKPKHG